VPAPRGVSNRLPGGACIPPLLEGWKHKILLAGKYLNVIRECGMELARDPLRADQDLSMEDEKWGFRLPICSSPPLTRDGIHIGSTNR
jgi:gamma-tubulin complex component 2